MDKNEHPRKIDYLLWYAGYGFSISSIALHIIDKLSYNKHWESLRELSAMGIVTSRISKLIITDNLIISTLFLLSMFFLFLLVYQSKNIVAETDKKTAQSYFLLSILLPCMTSIFVILQTIYCSLLVYRLGLGMNITNLPEYISWHKYYSMSSIFALTLSSALLIRETRLDYKNNAFHAVILAASPAIFSFANDQWYFVLACLVLILSACHLQWHILNIDELIANREEE